MGAITPGPDSLLVLRETLKNGFFAGFKTLCGIATGWVIYISILYFGFAHLVSGDLAQFVLSLAGGAYLLYLAFLLFRTKMSNIDFSPQEVESKHLYLKGLAINLSNPKAILFFTAIVAPYIDKSPAPYFILLFLGLNAGFLSVMSVAHFARRLITNRLFYVIDKICAVVFLVFGGGLLVLGIEKWGAL